MIIDKLNQDIVWILIQNLGQEDWRKAYSNSNNGRNEVQNEVPEPYLTEIMGVWGDTATVNDNPVTP